MTKRRYGNSRATLFTTSKPERAPASTVVLLACCLLLGFTTTSIAAGSQFSHKSWNALLKACVVTTTDGHSTAADYDCFAQRRELLDSYLNDLSDVSEATLLSLPKDVQLAFLINAYNAWTVALILNNWPGLESIRDLGSILRSPWKQSFIPFLGDTVSLDDIEHGMIRAPGRFDDPRIHFAVNCASIGCPALRQEAYDGNNIDLQLEEQTQSFLADPSRNRLQGDELGVSSIFKWYRDDFEQGWRSIDSLPRFLSRYGDSLKLTPAQTKALNEGDIDLAFLDYDWRLNNAQ